MRFGGQSIPSTRGGQRGDEVRADACVRRDASANPPEGVARVAGAGNAAREGVGRRRAIARHHADPGRQRRVRASEQFLSGRGAEVLWRCAICALARLRQRPKPSGRRATCSRRSPSDWAIRLRCAASRTFIPVSSSAFWTRDFQRCTLRPKSAGSGNTRPSSCRCCASQVAPASQSRASARA